MSGFHRPSSAQPIDSVFVSNKVGESATLKKYNDQAISDLCRHFRHIINSNGDTVFTLTDLEQKIVKSADAFLFLPIPKQIRQLKAPHAKELFREMFKAASLVVGKQTKDPNLHLDPSNPESAYKPMVFVNHEGCWDPFFELLEHMHRLGTVRASPRDILNKVNTVDEAIEVINKAHKKIASPGTHHGEKHGAIAPEELLAGQQDPEGKYKPDYNVCVFCSASTKNPELINIARHTGTKLALQGWGVISGMGAASMMGAVATGAAEISALQKEHKSKKRGWVAGSNLPRIIEMEGIPKYYDQIWLEDDIYQRMDVMVKNSQAFIVMPGGMGTVQELMGLLLLKHTSAKGGAPYRMRDERYANKPIILLNYKMTVDGHEVSFWDPLVKMAQTFGFDQDITVVDTVADAIAALKKHHDRHAKPAPVQR